MITSLASSILAEPQGDEQISPKSIAYASENARTQLHDLVLRTCEDAGISKATLAKRLGKDPAQISRLLGGSGNWTIDTAAQLLFAANGSLLEAHAYLPLRQAHSNNRAPQCFNDENDSGVDIPVVFVPTTKKRTTSTRSFSSDAGFKWQ